VDVRLRDKLRHRIEAEDAALMEEILQNPGNRIELREYAPSRADADLRAYNREVRDFNRALEDPDLSQDEKAHVAVVNDYREMLGLRRLFIDARLCRATGKHSAACDAAGRIWHNGPDGTPQSRAQAEGYPGGVAENVAIGYANGADIWWRGWYRASDHHRNALAAGHVCMGYGFAGSVGTQNFGSARPSSG
ncbi:MAG: CAP domain-containing protein, partial [Planctomycetes bacterium]|nr:CAP domain-containing protein [Planctomycetota bacterium]